MKILNKIKRFYQDSLCSEHDELQNLWRIQGYCIYCGKIWEPGVTRADIENELLRRRTERQKVYLKALGELSDKDLEKLYERSNKRVRAIP